MQQDISLDLTLDNITRNKTPIKRLILSNLSLPYEENFLAKLKESYKKVLSLLRKKDSVLYA
jgi:hypothetical protein